MNETSEDAYARLRLASAGDRPTTPTTSTTHDFNSPTGRSTLNSLSRNANAGALKMVRRMGSTSLVSKLKRFRGTLTADAEHRLNAVYANGVIEAGCNAHGRRKLRDAE